MKSLIKHKIASAAFGSTATHMKYEGVDLTIVVKYQTDVGEIRFDEITFKWAHLFRFENELHCVGYEPDSFDSIVELQGSPWLNDVLKKGRALKRSEETEMHHFSVYLNDVGRLDVIASDVLVNESTTEK